jgi:serine/threonine-protein kinase
VGQVLDALHAVHLRGIVHRDLKPENILLTTVERRGDFVKIFDFGVATFMESARDASHELTPTGRAMGTPYYASPEQLGGLSRRDPRIDVYAVGVVLYELLTGSRPFNSESFVELCRQVLEDEPPPMRVFRKNLPDTLEAVVRRALDKNIDNRFQDARALHEALVPFGARPPTDELDDPTDTFTIDLRELRARERAEEGRPTATSRAPDVRGLVADEALNVAEEQGGPGLAEMLRRALAGRPNPEAWYPEGLLGVLESGDEAFGSDDRRLLAEVGRAVARRLQRDGVISPDATPELLFARAADLWSQCFADGEPRVKELGLGYGLLEVSGHPRPRLSRAVLMMGLIDEALELVGGRRCEVRLAKAEALGDAADLYEASWST